MTICDEGTRSQGKKTEEEALLRMLLLIHKATAHTVNHFYTDLLSIDASNSNHGFFCLFGRSAETRIKSHCGSRRGEDSKCSFPGGD